MRWIPSCFLLAVSLNSSAGFSTVAPQYAESTASFHSDGRLTQPFRGRWLAECIRFENQNQSRYYGIEFNESTWSTFVFDFRSNSACLGIASPNDGRPLSYTYDRVEYQWDGRIRIEGTCVSGDNGCVGQNTIEVFFDGEQVEVRLVEASSIWFEPGLVQTVYASGPF